MCIPKRLAGTGMAGGFNAMGLGATAGAESANRTMNVTVTARKAFIPIDPCPFPGGTEATQRKTLPDALAEVFRHGFNGVLGCGSKRRLPQTPQQIGRVQHFNHRVRVGLRTVHRLSPVVPVDEVTALRSMNGDVSCE